MIHKNLLLIHKNKCYTYSGVMFIILHFCPLNRCTLCLQQWTVNLLRCVVMPSHWPQSWLGWDPSCLHWRPSGGRFLRPSCRSSSPQLSRLWCFSRWCCWNRPMLGHYYRLSSEGSSVVAPESWSKRSFHPHVLFPWASTGEFAFLVQEVEDAAEDGEEQQTQDDHNDDHSTALY